MQKKLPQIIVGVLVVAVISFYGGMKYSESKTVSVGGSAVGQGQQRGGGQFGGAGGARMGGNRGGAGFANGEVLSVDAKSLTVKMRDGSSKNIIISGLTQVLKSDAGSITDVIAGSQVTIIGAANTDGSITAQSIQIRPEYA